MGNIVRLLSGVNTCACHVYFAINLLTYLLTYLVSHLLAVVGSVSSTLATRPSCLSTSSLLQTPPPVS